ncbi:MAG: hypothetical protein AB7H93_09655 [Vicinamibacterales bacterium]
MAKKAKKAAKKKVSDRTLEAILIECALEVGRGVAATATISDAARKYWHSDFRRSIKKALADGEKWSKGKVTVLPLSFKMGAHAASLAKSGTIGKPEAKTAADQIKRDPTCGPPGSGKFCS